jgi:hypothetical protein
MRGSSGSVVERGNWFLLLSTVSLSFRVFHITEETDKTKLTRVRERDAFPFSEFLVYSYLSFILFMIIILSPRPADQHYLALVC